MKYLYICVGLFAAHWLFVHFLQTAIGAEEIVGAFGVLGSLASILFGVLYFVYGREAYKSGLKIVGILFQALSVVTILFYAFLLFMIWYASSW